MCLGQYLIRRNLLEALIVAITRRHAVVIRREAGRAGQWLMEEVRVFSPGLIQAWRFWPEKNNRGNRRHGCKLAGAAIVGDEQCSPME